MKRLSQPFNVALFLLVLLGSPALLYALGPNAIITTVAGNGTSGFSGDNGLATAAQLKGPVDVTLDGDGNLYIAEFFNSRIRKVSDNTVMFFLPLVLKNR